MGKKAKKHTNLASKKRRPSTGSLAALAPKAKPNAFETITPKRKFDILGRRTKGDKKNLAVVRGEGIQKRKNTLLQEFKKSGKSNSFVDRRFGEREGLTAEEKAIARFQRVRQAQVKKSGRFNLEDEGADEQLTHHGQALSNIDSFADGAPSDDDELPSHAARELDAIQVRQLHFGGGDDQRADGDTEVQKSKKEAMEELIAKSKYYKGLKKKEKEEDADALDALDATFRELSSKGEFRTGGQRMERPAVREKPDDYDRNVRELAQDIRATPGQRAQTAEEVAAAAAERLEELERQRVKRMRAGGGDDDDDDVDGPKGGFAARRAKRKKEEQEAGNGEDEDELELDSDAGDKSDDGDGSGSEGEEGSEEEQEEGDSGTEEDGSEIELDLDDLDPLQKRLKEVSAQMRPDLKAGWERLKKLMVADSAMMKECNAPDLDGAESQSDGCDGDDDDDDDGDEEEGSDGDSEQEEEEEEAPKKKKGDKEKAVKVEKEEKAAEAEKAAKAEKAKKEAKVEAAEAPSNKGKAERSVSGAAAETTSSSDLPFTFKAPATHAELAALVSKHCVGAVEGDAAALRLMVQRIRTCNAIHLNTDNRYAMQLFYGVLMQHFDSVVGQSPPALAHADALVPHLYEMAKEVPLYAATAARARLSKIQKQALTTQRESGSMAWPSVRAMLLLRLFTLIFPPSDHRHPVLAPAAIVVGGLLGQCPLASSSDAAAALFLCGIAHTLAAPSKRVAVEAMEAITLLLCAAAPPSVTADQLPEHLAARLMGRPLHLTTADGQSKSAAAAAQAGLPLSRVLAGEAGEGKKWLISPSFRAAAVAAALQAATQFVQLYTQLPCAPELVYELAAAAQRMGTVPVAAVEMHRQTLLTAVRRCVQLHSSRGPLRMHPKKQESIRVFNPKFEEEGYVPGRDYDPDKVRAEQRKLKKIIKKEQKGAARELRKDNYFLAEEKAKEVAVYEEGRAQKTNEVMAMLQKQESDFKSGGQGGMKLFGRKKKK